MAPPTKSVRVPILAPSAIFVGRGQEVRRVEQLLGRVSVALVYGMAGVGKSTLAYAIAGEHKGAIVYRRVVEGEELGPVVDDVRRQLASEPVAEAGSDRERLSDLARRMDEQGALWVLDDLHRLSEGARVELVETLGRKLRKGRLIATSREAVPRRSDGPDRLEIKLGELDEAAARALWKALDELYGEKAGFEAAWARCRGNPFLLRRAHAGNLSDEDPLAASVRALSPDERFVAGALAVSDLELPQELVFRLLPDDRARLPLRRLTMRMLVELDGAGVCGLHDLLREALRASLSPEEEARLRDALQAALRGSDVEIVPRVREVARNLAALGRHAERAHYLAEHAGELVAQGAAAELRDLLAAVPEAHRSAEVRLEQALAAERQLDLRAAHAELSSIAGGEAKGALARVALCMGRFEECERALAEGAGSPLVRAALRACQGRTSEALAELEAAGSGPERGWPALAKALLLWLQEQDDALEAALADALASFRGAEGEGVARALAAGALARVGRAQEADEALAAGKAVAAGGDLRLTVDLRLARAAVLAERGERLAALSELQHAVTAAEEGGYALAAMLARAGVGRVFLALGRRLEGLSQLDDVERRAAEVGAAGVAALARQAREEDPLVRVGRVDARAVPESRRAESFRAKALAAVRAAGAGDALAVVGLVEQLARVPGGQDFAVERSLAHLARGVLARLEGRADEAKSELERAVTAAAEGGADPDIVPKLAAALGDVSVITPGARRLSGSAPAANPDAPVLDGRTHELRAGGKVVSLKKRVLPRRLLYALARRPGEVLTKDECTRAVWGRDYNPLMHDNPLRVNVRYVRELLEGTGLKIAFEDPGYRLEAPADFVFVAPSG